MPVAEDDPRLAKCGFAKLQGDGIEVYIRKYNISLGRRSKSTQLDVILGDHRNISRKHACIRYNFDKGVFELVVLGKNGVTIRSGSKGVLHTPSSPPTQLRSQDMIQMGDKSFYFLLPKDASRLGPPPAKRRISPGQYVVSQPAPSTANGSDFDSAPALDPPLAGSSEEQKSRVRAADEPQQVVSASPGAGEGSMVEEASAGGSGRKRKVPEVNSDPQDLVFTHPSPMGVQGAQLYHPGGLA